MPFILFSTCESLHLVNGRPFVINVAKRTRQIHEAILGDFISSSRALNSNNIKILFEFKALELLIKDSYYLTGTLLYFTQSGTNIDI